MAPSWPMIGVDDMISLARLDEDTLMDNLKQRYDGDQIYTYTGSILVSMNPYKALPIYETEIVQKYRGQRMGTLPPHIFATADTAYRNMKDHTSNQSVIISGESGAGKSESTKLILQYLAAMTGNHSWVEQQILEAGTVLEAFGNAKTVRNNNSSRFGKFIEVHFGKEGNIVGARIIQYLLEKSRVVFQAPSERNYHIFYELVSGADAEERANYHILPIEKYQYLSKSGCIKVDGVDDVEQYNAVKVAMTVLGISEETQSHLFRVLSAVLLLGNLEFKAEKDGSLPKNPELATTIAELLAVDPNKLISALTSRNLRIRGQEIQVALKPEQAVDTRDALAKGLYGKLFVWLVDAINLSINVAGPSSLSFIGVLDIFGFENFQVNSFEQMCINYANEKLQQYFNQHIFKLEQEEYTKEQIPWDSIKFVDNQECLDLIEKKPICLLSMLDEECRFPNGSDGSLLEKLHQKLEKHKYYVRNKRSRTAFGVLHYAGEVQYETAGFLDKNKDTLFDDLVLLLQSSRTEFISSLYPASANPVGDQAASSKKTIGTQFKDELNSLMSTLSATHPHYVRCIKPNPEKKPKIFDPKLVSDQLRFSGMLDTIKIRQAGFPIRFDYDSFCKRFHPLRCNVGHRKDRKKQAPLIASSAGLSTKESASQILKQWAGSTETWRLGLTKVFLKEKLDGELSDHRNTRCKLAVSIIQLHYKGHKQRQWYKKLILASLIFQRNIRMFHARSSYDRKQRASTKLGTIMNAARARAWYSVQRRAAVRLQLAAKKYYAIKKRTRILKAIITIQAAWKMYRQRKNYKAKKAFVILLQAAIRGRLTRPKFMPELERRMKILSEDESRMPIAEQQRRQKLREEEARKAAALAASIAAEEERKRQEEEAIKRAAEDAERKVREEERDRERKQREAAELLEREKVLREEQERERLLRELELASKAEGVDDLESTSVEEGLSVEDFESTLAELQSFIEGDVFTSLADGATASNSAPSQVVAKFESNVPSPSPTQTETKSDSNASEEEPRLDRDCLENYEPADQEESNDDLPSPLNVYLDYKSFKLEAYAMNHFTPPAKKIKKDTWLKLLTFSKKPLAASLNQFKETHLSNEALSIFDAIMKYQGVLSQRQLLRKLTPQELAVYVVGKGLEVPELRDEIYCQLCKQTNGYPDQETGMRAWELLSLVCSSYPPSKPLIKYVCNYLQSSIPQEGDCGRMATFTLKRLTRTLQAQSGRLMGGVVERKCPPSELEIDAMKNRRTIIVRVHTTDGTAKALDLDALTTTKEIFKATAEKIGLTQTAGFALFEEVDSGKETYERGLTPKELLGDILYKWEHNALSSKYKIILKKKLFLPPLPDPIDPVAKDLVFSQAFSDIIDGKLPCDENSAVKLAAYKIQATWGDHDKMNMKSLELDKHIPKRLITKYSTEEWLKKIAPLHQELKGIDSTVAKDMFVKYVKKWSLYGSTFFHVKGYGDLDRKQIVLAISWSGMHILDRNTKQVLYSYDHNDVIQCAYTSTKFNFTVELRNGSKKQFMFQTQWGVEIDPLIRIYNAFYRKYFKKTTPAASKGSTVASSSRDRQRQKEAEEAEKRASAWSHNTEDVEMPVPILQAEEQYPFKSYAVANFLPSTPLAYLREPLTNPMHQSVEESGLSKDAVSMAQLIVKYMLEAKADVESTDWMRQIIDMGIKKPKLRNELFCQIIKQTTQNPNIENCCRGWQLMAAASGTFLPTKELAPYLRTHFQIVMASGGADEKSLRDYASYASIRLQRTVVYGAHKDTPSMGELLSIATRRPFPLRVLTLDGKAKTIGLDPTLTAREVCRKISTKIELRDFRGFALYEIFNDNWDEEKSLPDSELLGDVLQRHEEAERKGAKAQLYFKRKTWPENPNQEIRDPVMLDLMYHQALHDVMNDKLPLLEKDATDLAALHMQVVWGDQRDAVRGQLLTQTLEETLGKRWATKLQQTKAIEDVVLAHNALTGTKTEEAKAKYLAIVRKWSLYGSSVFNVRQNSRPNLPKDLWLVVGLDAVHLLKPGEADAVLSFKHEATANYGGSTSSFFMMTGNLMNSQKHVFNSKQGNEIANVLSIYMAEVNSKQKK